MLTELFLRAEPDRSWPFPALPAPVARTLRESGTGQAAGAFTGFAVSPEAEVIAFARDPDLARRIFAQLHGSGQPQIGIAGPISFNAAGRRPVQGGHSIGRGARNGESGTLGCVVQSRGGTDRFGLTCNHVAAQMNAATRGATEIWAPGTAQGGSAADRLGTLYDFHDIDFTSGAPNYIDAALILPDNVSDLDPSVLVTGAVNGINNALSFGDALAKTGAVSGHTTGAYRFRINASIDYANGRSAIFHDLIGIVGSSATSDFAKQGDSGALVVCALKKAVGLLISVAQGIDLTLATPIQTVLDHFNVDVV